MLRRNAKTAVRSLHQSIPFDCCRKGDPRGCMIERRPRDIESNCSAEDASALIESYRLQISQEVFFGPRYEDRKINLLGQEAFPKLFRVKLKHRELIQRRPTAIIVGIGDEFESVAGKSLDPIWASTDWTPIEDIIPQTLVCEQVPR